MKIKRIEAPVQPGPDQKAEQVARRISEARMTITRVMDIPQIDEWVRAVTYALTFKKSVKTAQVDLNNIVIVNVDFAYELNNQQLNYLLLHEIIHRVLGHNERSVAFLRRKIHNLDALAEEIEKSFPYPPQWVKERLDEQEVEQWISGWTSFFGDSFDVQKWKTIILQRIQQALNVYTDAVVNAWLYVLSMVYPNLLCSISGTIIPAEESMRELMENTVENFFERAFENAVVAYPTHEKPQKDIEKIGEERPWAKPEDLDQLIRRIVIGEDKNVFDLPTLLERNYWEDFQETMDSRSLDEWSGGEDFSSPGSSPGTGMRGGGMKEIFETDDGESHAGTEEDDGAGTRRGKQKETKGDWGSSAKSDGTDELADTFARYSWQRESGKEFLKSLYEHGVNKYGNRPGIGGEPLVFHKEKGKIPWEKVLRDLLDALIVQPLTETRRKREDWTRKHPRVMGEEAFVPRTFRPKESPLFLVVVRDTSGSMSKTTLEKVVGEILEVERRVKISGLIVVDADVLVQGVLIYVLDQGREFEIKHHLKDIVDAIFSTADPNLQSVSGGPQNSSEKIVLLTSDQKELVKWLLNARGRGGTSFRHVFLFVKRLLSKRNMQGFRSFPTPCGVVYITDLEGEMPDRKDNPEIPTIWVVPEHQANAKVPFGAIVAVPELWKSQ